MISARDSPVFAAGRRLPEQAPRGVRPAQALRFRLRRESRTAGELADHGPGGDFARGLGEGVPDGLGDLGAVAGPLVVDPREIHPVAGTALRRREPSGVELRGGVDPSADVAQGVLDGQPLDRA